MADRDEKKGGFKSLSDTAGDKLGKPEARRDEPRVPEPPKVEAHKERNEARPEAKGEARTEQSDIREHARQDEHERPGVKAKEGETPFKAPPSHHAANTAPGPAASEEMPPAKPLNKTAEKLVEKGMHPHKANSMTGPGSNQ